MATALEAQDDGFEVVPGTNLYVKNLDSIVDDDYLHTVFKEFGKITSAKVMRNEIGISKGFGFVCFETPEEAAVALKKMNGAMVGSKPLYVSIAQKKADRQAFLAEQLKKPFHERVYSVAAHTLTSTPSAIKSSAVSVTDTHTTTTASFPVLDRNIVTNGSALTGTQEVPQPAQQPIMSALPEIRVGRPHGQFMFVACPVRPQVAAAPIANIRQHFVKQPVPGPPVQEQPVAGPPVQVQAVPGPPVQTQPVAGPRVWAQPVAGPPVRALHQPVVQLPAPTGPLCVGARPYIMFNEANTRPQRAFRQIHPACWWANPAVGQVGVRQVYAPQPDPAVLPPSLIRGNGYPHIPVPVGMTRPSMPNGHTSHNQPAANGHGALWPQVLNGHSSVAEQPRNVRWANANGQYVGGRANGYSSAYSNYTNGFASGASNGRTNGHTSGHTIGRTSGHWNGL